MEDRPHKYKFHSLQEFLIGIHQKLTRITKTECLYFNTDIQNDYMEKLIECLIAELKKYDMYSKFEAMSYEHRQKELLILLTKELGVKVHQNEAGDMGTQRNTFNFSSVLHNCGSTGDNEYKLNEDSIPSCVRHFYLTALQEAKNPKNAYVQYQLYSNILHKIHQELSGVCAISDPVVNVLLTGLWVRHQHKGHFEKPAAVPDAENRREMLRLLAAKLMDKCNQISLLDLVRDTANEVNDTLCRKYYYPNKMWEKIINMEPKQDLMESLYNNYPIFITEMFLEYLSEAKECIILQQEKMFDVTISLLKKEALETVGSLKKHLESKKCVESFLYEYTQELEDHYEITENEFYRQLILKKHIKDISTKIMKDKIKSKMKLKEIYKDIHKQMKVVQHLCNKLKKVVNRVA